MSVSKGRVWGVGKVYPQNYRSKQYASYWNAFSCLIYQGSYLLYRKENKKRAVNLLHSRSADLSLFVNIGRHNKQVTLTVLVSILSSTAVCFA